VRQPHEITAEPSWTATAPPCVRSAQGRRAIPYGIAALGTAALHGSTRARGWRRSAPPPVLSTLRPPDFERPDGERLLFLNQALRLPPERMRRGAKEVHHDYGDLS
jgi:hypothetical protein